VTVSIREQENNVELVIENPGAPIPEEHLPKLFDRFIASIHQDSVKAKAAGSGLPS
jgi:two-component system heavy metal sensor histidine kinase CusS